MRTDVMLMSGTGTPHKGMMPACSDAMGCAVLAALPCTPVSAPVPVVWAAVCYRQHSCVLDGRSVEPELFPPITAA